jgi:hypothetical protein
LENVVSPDIIDKFKNSLLARGQAFDEMADKLELDKELEGLFDEKTKKVLDKLIRSITFTKLRKILSQRIHNRK